MNAAHAMTYKPKRAADPCTCKAYAFPHRPGSGKCFDDGSRCFCGHCGQPCTAKTMDFGYGRLEAWGQKFTHTDIQTVSHCCEADVYADASLTKDYEPEDDDGGY